MQEYYIVHPETKNVQNFILKGKVFVAVDETTGVIHSELFQTTVAF